MMKKNNNDVSQIIDKIKKILNEKPSSEIMLREIRMMRFKIRPVQGDFSLINLKNTNLIEILWRLGKLDDIYQKEYKNIPKSDRESFYRIYDNFNSRLQQQLSKINIKEERNASRPQILEMEIFKENTRSQKVN
jgi:hypothetical protein